MTDKREVFFLIGRGGAILWSDTGNSAVAIADSRTRWNAIWERRTEVEEVAHSHPVGPARFSREDETTMQALDSGLGKRLRYSIVSPAGMVVRDGHDGEDTHVASEPWWASVLRRASGMGGLEPPRAHDDCIEALRAILTRQLRSRARLAVRQAADLVIYDTDDADSVYLVVDVATHATRARVREHNSAGVEEVWIVDLPGRCIEVFRDLRDDRYNDLTIQGRGAVLALSHFDDIGVCVDDIV